jgi:hypothetical protein
LPQGGGSFGIRHFLQRFLYPADTGSAADGCQNMVLKMAVNTEAVPPGGVQSTIPKFNLC